MDMSVDMGVGTSVDTHIEVYTGMLTSGSVTHLGGRVYGLTCVNE